MRFYNYAECTEFKDMQNALTDYAEKVGNMYSDFVALEEEYISQKEHIEQLQAENLRLTRRNIELEKFLETCESLEPVEHYLNKIMEVENV
jgi:2-phospho-L-lactate transferase/gluconeogenesis factor (CofD/UPF0052 family)